MSDPDHERLERYKLEHDVRKLKESVQIIWIFLILIGLTALFGGFFN